jgi:hypothetical protein
MGSKSKVSGRRTNQARRRSLNVAGQDLLANQPERREKWRANNKAGAVVEQHFNEFRSGRLEMNRWRRILINRAHLDAFLEISAHQGSETER